MIEQPSAPSRFEFLNERGYAPDEFQLRAFQAVDENRSVLVAAPTSSGKTLVAEYAIAKALEEGQSVVYTCLLYTSPSPRDATLSRMPSSA